MDLQITENNINNNYFMFRGTDAFYKTKQRYLFE
jgi:hypothetical protein